VGSLKDKKTKARLTMFFKTKVQSIKYGVFIWLAVSNLFLDCDSVSDKTTRLFSESAPSYFPDKVNEPDQNQTNKEGVKLGRMLFFDKSLSKKNDVSCATCHNPTFAFADTSSLSSGHQGQFTKRNTPPILNLAWAKNFFWDGGGKNLESVSLAPLHQDGEMGWKDLLDLEKRLQSNQKYCQLFKATFDTDTIQLAYILRALAQFQRSIVHSESKWDKWKLNKLQFESKELAGMSLFNQKCSSCHTPPLFTDDQFHQVTNEKTDTSNSKDDAQRGRARITQNKKDEHQYRTPTLRAILKTAPYLHDGRYKDLNNLLFSPEFNQMHAKTQLSNHEKDLLIRFIITLD